MGEWFVMSTNFYANISSDIAPGVEVVTRLHLGKTVGGSSVTLNGTWFPDFRTLTVFLKHNEVRNGLVVVDEDGVEYSVSEFEGLFLRFEGAARRAHKTWCEKNPSQVLEDHSWVDGDGFTMLPGEWF